LHSAHDAGFNPAFPVGLRLTRTFTPYPFPARCRGEPCVRSPVICPIINIRSSHISQPAPSFHLPFASHGDTSGNMKNRSDLTFSHDKLFKEVWSDLENARVFLENYLPSELLAVMDLASLEIHKGSFVEKNLKEYHSDLLYRVKTSNGQAFIYVLFEHKSYPDSLIHFQLLKYMIGIWSLGLKQNRSKKLSPIVPLVMYHGKKPWSAPERFSGLFDEELDLPRVFVPDFQYLLFDLSRYSDEEIRGTILVRVVLMMFKYVFDPSFEDKLPGIFRLFSDLLRQETGLQTLETLLRYLIANIEDMGVEKFKEIVEQSMSEKEGDTVMAFANTMLGKSYKRGVEQGMQQGLREAVIDLIEVRFGAGADTESAKRLVQSLDDLDRLKALKQSVKSGAAFDELMSMLGN